MCPTEERIERISLRKPEQCILCIRKDLLEGGGERRPESLEFAGGGMRKREKAGVECEAAEGVGFGAVFLIAHDGASKAG